MENMIFDEIRNSILEFSRIEKPITKWKKPLLGFAAANDRMFEELKEVISKDHLMPRDINHKANTVIAYFLPFVKEIPDSNIKGRLASEDWAIAYVETNKLIAYINLRLIDKLEALGYRTKRLDPSLNMDYSRLISRWSNRHVSYIAGLGRFGLNNMLITENGCCGRLGNVVTELKLKPTPRIDKESCLFKENGTCGACADRCVNSALFRDRFNRFKCYEICKENERLYKHIGEAEVCGKCLVGVPCSFKNPVKQ